MYVSPNPSLLQLLQQRGPDSTGRVVKAVRRDESTAEQVYLTFTSTVLSLRGSETIEQPYEDVTSSSVLCWNGEAWSVDDRRTEGNDTITVANVLSRATTASQQADDGADTADLEHAFITETMATIAGPFAFVYYSSTTQAVYFGRDFLGRRSLVWRAGDDGELTISSAAPGSIISPWSELEADGIYRIKLGTSTSNPQESDPAGSPWGDFDILRKPYAFATDAQQVGQSSVIPLLSLNTQAAKSPLKLTCESPSVSHLDRLLCKSLERRVLNIPDPPLLRTKGSGNLQPTKLAILFSGGLDCTVLARMTDDLLPATEPVDLLNVAFENPRIHKPVASDAGPNTAAFESCPDRITGRASYNELQEICPHRPWRFVAIDVAYRETLEHRDQVIALMHPHNTEMDLSIAYALYFAARGAGNMSASTSTEAVSYTTSARVLLSGLGADELFAGYTRHATAFNRHGFAGLIDELKLDIGRLGRRNLGRDDRVISNWGREARFPFLDEELVGWALAAPVLEKCDFGAPDPSQDTDSDPSALLEPGKKVLRCLAWKMGMRKVASEKKRAIQFGARTAKMETGRSKGTTLLS